MSRRPTLTGLDDERHGTTNGYCNHGCRCADCRRAWARYQAALKAKRTPPGPGDPRHGTNNLYVNFSCRCASCREAHTDYAFWRYQQQKARGWKA